MLGSPGVSNFLEFPGYPKAQKRAHDTSDQFGRRFSPPPGLAGEPSVVPARAAGTRAGLPAKPRQGGAGTGVIPSTHPVDGLDCPRTQSTTVASHLVSRRGEPEVRGWRGIEGEALRTGGRTRLPLGVCAKFRSYARLPVR
jgi:hypothetical protein